MTDIVGMRNFVSQMYDGDSWKRRVKKMSDSQVTAIYVKQQKNVDKANKKRRKKPDIPF